MTIVATDSIAIISATPDGTQPNISYANYNTNGETISLDIVGDPGTQSEEVITQSLDGSSAYVLNWSTYHKEFEIKVDMSTTTTNTPRVNTIELGQPIQDDASIITSNATTLTTSESVTLFS